MTYALAAPTACVNAEERPQENPELGSFLEGQLTHRRDVPHG